MNYQLRLPFGSQRPEAFDEAEPFLVIDTPLPLNELTVNCAQGLVLTHNSTALQFKRLIVTVDMVVQYLLTLLSTV